MTLHIPHSMPSCRPRAGGPPCLFTGPVLNCPKTGGSRDKNLQDNETGQKRLRNLIWRRWRRGRWRSRRRWFPWRVRSRVGVAEGVWREGCVCACELSGCVWVAFVCCCFACDCVLELVVCRVRFARVSCPWLRFEYACLTVQHQDGVKLAELGLYGRGNPLTRQDAGKRGNSRSPSRWLHPREVT